MNKTLINYFTSVVALILTVLSQSCSSSDKSDNAVIFKTVSLNDNVTETTNLSDIFVDYKIIPLETNDKSLIGGWTNKIIKRADRFFVSSINDVIVFDLNGKYVNKLSRFGSGPEEYEQLYDYDVVEKFGEIWVSSRKGIYRYKFTTMEYTGLIPLPFFANKFKYLDDGSIIAFTPEPESFKIIDMSGATIKSYYEADPANSTVKCVQFITLGDLIVSQLENSNDAIVYDLGSKRFDISSIITPTPSLETPEINRDYLKQYGYLDQSKKVMETYTGISSFRKVGDVTMLVVREPGKKWILNVTDNNQNKGFEYAPETDCRLINDLTPPTHPLIYNTMTSGESDDSFIFTFTADDDNENNLSILEVKKVSL